MSLEVYKQDISDHLVSAVADKKKLKVSCTKAKNGKAVMEAITALYGSAYNITKEKHGVSYKDFTLKMGSKEEASALANALKNIKSTVPKSPEPEPEQEPVIVPDTSGDVPQGGGSKKTVIIVSVAVAVVLLVVAVILLNKK